MIFQFTDYCVCPECYSELGHVGESLQCQSCKRVYEIRNGIPILLPLYEDETRQSYLENYERMAVDDLQVPLEQRRDYRHKVLFDFIGNVKGKRILDIGSSNALYLSKMDAAFKVAFDISLPFLNAISVSDNLTRICGDAERLPFKCGFFDVIIISDILEHLLTPENLIRRVMEFSIPETQIFVHIPWEENLETYAGSKYKFAHLRSFSAFTYAELWANFCIKRAKSSYPNMKYPLLFQLEGKIPFSLYNKLVARYFFNPSVGKRDLEWRTAKMNALPKGERWLLWFFKPVFRIFEMRLRQRRKA